MEAQEVIRGLHEFTELHCRNELLNQIRSGERFLVIDFIDLSKHDPELAEYLLDNPEDMLKAAELAVESFDMFGDVSGFKVRFKNLPKTQEIMIKDIRSDNIGKFVSVAGIVRQKSDVRPQVTTAKFECPNCGNVIAVLQLDQAFKEPTRCGCGRKGKFRLLDKELVDAQSLVLEEAPEDLEGGEQPKRINVFLKSDLVSPLSEKRTNPGSKIKVIGEIMELPIVLRTGSKSTKFDLYVEANYVDSVEETFLELEINPEEEGQIKEIASSENVFERVAQSIAPSVYGHERIKEALLLQLMGGVQKIRKDGSVTRGDIHVLLVGDPGAAKSQMLKRINIVAPRCRYVSGKGVSAAGLCVAPDSVVALNSGNLARISEIVEKEHVKGKSEYIPGIWESPNKSGQEILTLGDNLKVNAAKIDTFWKLKAPETMIRLTTQSGKSVMMTPHTKILTIEEGQQVWKESRDIKTSERIAAARSLPGSNEKIPTLSLISSNPVCHGAEPLVRRLVHAVAKKYGTIRNAAKALELSEGSMYYNWVNKNARGTIKLNDLKLLIREAGLQLADIAGELKSFSLYNGKPIQLPAFLNEEFLYFAGLMAGDGDLSRGPNTVSIRFSNSNDGLLRVFSQLCKELFGVECNVTPGNHQRPTSLRFHSKIVAEILNGLGIPLSPKSHRITVKGSLMKLENKLIAAYLRGLFDADGSVINREGGSRIVEFTTTSKNLAKYLQLLLLRFSVHSKLRTREPYEGVIRSKYVKYVLTISSRSNLVAFREGIGFGHKRKKRILDTVIQSIQKVDTNVDVVPEVGVFIREAKAQLGATSRDFAGYKSSVISTASYSPSKTQLTKMIQSVQQKGEGSSSAMESLKALADSDLLWDKVVSIEEVSDHGFEFVYDLTVANTHNFLVNGVVVHNTATVVRDEFLKGWSLEAGAMVLASNGVCCIDELDKMSPEDRAAMHESLENQTVSISKANIQATLIARTTVLAAANPKLGRFDPYDILAKQIDLPPTLINRFDMIFPIKDMPNVEKDEQLASHILGLHKNPDSQFQEISTDMLKKYLAYAKQRVFPKLTNEAIDEIKTYYVELRNKEVGEEGAMRTIPISPRQLEALVRMSEAAARVRLSETVTGADARKAIDLLHFCLGEVGFDPETGKIDIDKIATGITSSQRGHIVTVREIIADLENKIGKTIPISDILEYAGEKGIDEAKVEEAIEKLKRSGDVFEPRRGWLSRI